MTSDDKLPTQRSSEADVQAFLRRVAATPSARPTGGRGRLIFAMDATASREPSWDRACHLQAEMFRATRDLGGLDVQLVFYRGFRECRASPWIGDSDALLRRMTAVRCMAGETQLGRVLVHAARETKASRVNALVFVGDAFEENLDRVAQRAGELGVLGVPCFLFHEGRDPIAGRAFREVARLTGGAYCPFDEGSAEQLKALIGAVAAFAAGGYVALEAYGDRGGEPAKRLGREMRRLGHRKG